MIQDSDYAEAAQWEIPPVDKGTIESGSKLQRDKTKPKAIFAGENFPATFPASKGAKIGANR